MKKILVLIIAITIVYSCCHKKEYKYTIAVNKYNNDNGCPVKLYLEYYCTFSGYLTTDLNSVYLTDSTNFKVDLGQYDTGNEWITTDCKGDSLYAKKMLRVEPYFKIDTLVSTKNNLQVPDIIYPPKVLESKVYSLSALKRGWRFW